MPSKHQIKFTSSQVLFGNKIAAMQNLIVKLKRKLKKYAVITVIEKNESGWREHEANEGNLESKEYLHILYLFAMNKGATNQQR